MGDPGDWDGWETAEGRCGRVWRSQAAASGCHLREAGGAQMRLSGCGGALSVSVSYSHSRRCLELTVPNASSGSMSWSRHSMRGRGMDGMY